MTLYSDSSAGSELKGGASEESSSNQLRLIGPKSVRETKNSP